MLNLSKHFINKDLWFNVFTFLELQDLLSLQEEDEYVTACMKQSSFWKDHSPLKLHYTFVCSTIEFPKNLDYVYILREYPITKVSYDEPFTYKVCQRLESFNGTSVKEVYLTSGNDFWPPENCDSLVNYPADHVINYYYNDNLSLNLNGYAAINHKIRLHTRRLHIGNCYETDFRLYQFLYYMVQCEKVETLYCAWTWKPLHFECAIKHLPNLKKVIFPRSELMIGHHTLPYWNLMHVLLNIKKIGITLLDFERVSDSLDDPFNRSIFNSLKKLIIAFPLTYGRDKVGILSTETITLRPFKSAIHLLKLAKDIPSVELQINHNDDFFPVNRFPEIINSLTNVKYLKIKSDVQIRFCFFSKICNKSIEKLVIKQKYNPNSQTPPIYDLYKMFPNLKYFESKSYQPR